MNWNINPLLINNEIHNYLNKIKDDLTKQSNNLVKSSFIKDKNMYFYYINNNLIFTLEITNSENKIILYNLIGENKIGKIEIFNDIQYLDTIIQNWITNKLSSLLYNTILNNMDNIENEKKHQESVLIKPIEPNPFIDNNTDDFNNIKDLLDKFKKKNVNDRIIKYFNFDNKHQTYIIGTDFSII